MLTNCPTIEGCTTLAEAGEPALPVRVLHFVIPNDVTVDGVDVSFVEEEIAGLTGSRPCSPRCRWVRRPRRGSNPIPAIYEGEGVFPAERAVYMGDGYMAGYRIASVAVYPLQYEPRSGRLILARGIDVDSLLRAGGRPVAAPAPHHAELVAAVLQRDRGAGRERGRRPPAAAPGQRRSTTGRAPPGSRRGTRPSLEGSAVEYVIITNEELEPYFEDLAEWRTKMGLPAVVRTVSWIESNYPGGCDTAEKIRMFIRDAYSSWGTTYVLLGGDTNIIPPRYCFTSYYGSVYVPGDMYYSSLEGNWNADNDYIFGEGYRGYHGAGRQRGLLPGRVRRPRSRQQHRGSRERSSRRRSRTRRRPRP